MDNQLEKNYGGVILYMATAARLLHAQGNTEIATMEEWKAKMTELAKMAKCQG